MPPRVAWPGKPALAQNFLSMGTTIGFPVCLEYSVFRSATDFGGPIVFLTRVRLWRRPGESHDFGALRTRLAASGRAPQSVPCELIGSSVPSLQRSRNHKSVAWLERRESRLSAWRKVRGCASVESAMMRAAFLTSLRAARDAAHEVRSATDAPPVAIPAVQET